jgi:hypothetical protein
MLFTMWHTSCLQMEAWQHVKPLAWLDRLINMPAWKVQNGTVISTLPVAAHRQPLTCLAGLTYQQCKVVAQLSATLRQ